MARDLITLRVDPDLLALLDADTDSETSRSAVIRRIIRQHYTAQAATSRRRKAA